MKYFIYFLLSIYITPISVYGQTVRELNLHFNLNDFSFQKDESGNTYISSQLYTISYMSDTKTPALPKVSVCYLIGNDEIYDSVRYSADENLIRTDVKLAPNPRLHKTNTISDYKTDTISFVYEKRIYPASDDIVTYTGTQILGGYRYVTFLVSPFKYDTIEKKLYLKSDITLSLCLSRIITTPKNAYTSDYNILKSLKGLVRNYSQLSDIYEITGEVNDDVGVTRSPSTTNYEYLIITNNALKSAFQDLVTWKTMKGVKSKILTTEEIGNLYTGNSLHHKIKKALKDYYNGTYSGLKYALLGGDIDIVPSRMCYIEFSPNDTTHTIKTTPSDLYYACFDNNFEWDANGNNVYGEVDDNVDLSPEIVITRIPVNTLSEAGSYVSRIINYEKNPDTNNWSKNILMGGHALSFYLTNLNLSDSEVKADSFYIHYIQQFWDGGRTKLFNTYEGDSSHIFNSTNLQEKLEEGFTFADIITHGVPIFWDMRGLDFYDTTKAQNLINSGNTLITTIACFTNAFDSVSTCLSEAFIRNDSGGILGYLGCSREGWYYIWPTFLGPSFDYNGEFYKSLFTDADGRYGLAVNMSKNKHVSLCSSYTNPYRWIMLGLNPIGDPEMPIYIDVPRRFENLNISLSSGTLNVSTGESDCTICVSSTDYPYWSYYDVRNGSTATFTSVIDGYCICITKPGFIPFIATINSTTYIQDETITGDYNVVSENVYVGSDVTTSMSQGPVIIESGNVELYGTNEVFIKNDFTVENGASLKIATGN